MNSNSKGFAQFLVILAGSLVIILLIVTFAFKNGQIKLTSQGSISPTPSNQVINDVWKDWETYKTNVCTESVVTFKYPSNIKVQPSTLGNRLSLFWDGSDLLIGIGISYIPNSQLDSYEYKSIKSLLRLDVGNSTTTFQTGDWKEIFTRKPNEDIGGKTGFIYEAPFGWGRPYPIKLVLIPQEKGYCEILIEYDTPQQINNYPFLLDQILSTFKFLDQSNTSDWKTYTSSKYGFSFKYPPNYILKDWNSESNIISSTSLFDPTILDKYPVQNPEISVGVHKRNNLTLLDWINNNCTNSNSIKDTTLDSKPGKQYTC